MQNLHEYDDDDDYGEYHKWVGGYDGLVGGVLRTDSYPDKTASDWGARVPFSWRRHGGDDDDGNNEMTPTKWSSCTPRPQ